MLDLKGNRVDMARNHAEREAMLRLEVNYARGRFEARLRAKCERVLAEQLEGEPSGDNAALVVATATRLVLEDQAADQLAADIAHMGL